jgi:hypothetical protein
MLPENWGRKQTRESLTRIYGERSLKVFDLVRDYTHLLATEGVFALVIMFIFIVERRAIKDLNKAAEAERNAIKDLKDALNEAQRESYEALCKNNASVREYLLRNHRSAVRVRNILLIPAVLVWAYAIFFPPERPKVITMHDLSSGQFNLQINPQDVAFEYYKRDYTGGEVKWDVRPKSDKTRWIFTASHIIAAGIEPSEDGPAQLSKEPARTDERRQPKPLKSKEIVLNVSSDGPDEYIYKLDSDAGAARMGHLYAKDNAGTWTVKLPWADEAPPPKSTSHASGWVNFNLLQAAYAQTSLCGSNGMPKDPEQVLNDLGSRDLGIRLAARKALVDSAANCLTFLEYAVKNTQSTLYRDRPLLVESLTESLKQMKGVTISDRAYADLGKQNYDLGNYAEAIILFGSISGSFLKGEPDYLFYKGYAEIRRNQYHDAVSSMSQFVAADPQEADNTTVRVSFGEALYQSAVQKQKGGDVAGACREYRQAIQQFDLAITKDATLANPSKKGGFFRSSAQDHLRVLGCR